MLHRVRNVAPLAVHGQHMHHAIDYLAFTLPCRPHRASAADQ